MSRGCPRNICWRNWIPKTHPASSSASRVPGDCPSIMSLSEIHGHSDYRLCLRGIKGNGVRDSKCTLCNHNASRSIIEGYLLDRSWNNRTLPCGAIERQGNSNGTDWEVTNTEGVGETKTKVWGRERQLYCLAEGGVWEDCVGPILITCTNIMST